MSLSQIPNTKLLEDPTRDAIWKRWLGSLRESSNSLLIGSTINGGIATRVLFEGNGGVLADDSGFTFNSSTNALTLTGAVYAPEFGSNAAGQLLLSTAGGTQLRIGHTASAVNFIQITGGISGNAPNFRAEGSDPNIELAFSAKGNNAIGCYTSTFAQLQFAVMHTASANRHITVTGSNGGNPSIDVSAGNLAITPATNFAGIVTFNAPATLKGYAVSTLPAGVQGHLAFATDLLTPAFLAAAIGGGAIVGPVFYNGSAWVSV